MIAVLLQLQHNRCKRHNIKARLTMVYVSFHVDLLGIAANFEALVSQRSIAIIKRHNGIPLLKEQSERQTSHMHRSIRSTNPQRGSATQVRIRTMIFAEQERAGWLRALATNGRYMAASLFHELKCSQMLQLLQSSIPSQHSHVDEMCISDY